MRISEIRIENFGKLRNVQFAPGPGMNLVYAPNEGGKSTLHAFIRGMFFGMARMRGRAARTDAYSRYEPWENPEIYGGRMRLECGGKQFRLSRSFSRDASVRGQSSRSAHQAEKASRSVTQVTILPASAGL